MTILGLQWLSYGETVRSNQAREKENTRHNIKSEDLSSMDIQENIRNNKFRNSLDATALGETVRNNKFRNAMEAGNLAEFTRNNMKISDIRTSELGEEILSNRNSEALKAKDLAERQRQYDVALLPQFAQSIYGLNNAHNAGMITDAQKGAGIFQTSTKYVGDTLSSFVGLGKGGMSLKDLMNK